MLTIQHSSRKSMAILRILSTPTILLRNPGLESNMPQILKPFRMAAFYSMPYRLIFRYSVLGSIPSSRAAAVRLPP